MRKMRPLASCVNGCQAVPQLPSLVLCASCLAGLDDKFNALADLFAARGRALAKPRERHTAPSGRQGRDEGET